MFIPLFTLLLVLVLVLELSVALAFRLPNRIAQRAFFHPYPATPPAPA